MTSSNSTFAVHEVYAYLRVRDAAGALDFYKRAFGAEELFRLTEPSGRIGDFPGRDAGGPADGSERAGHARGDGLGGVQVDQGKPAAIELAWLLVSRPQLRPQFQPRV